MSERRCRYCYANDDGSCEVCDLAPTTPEPETVSEDADEWSAGDVERVARWFRRAEDSWDDHQGRVEIPGGILQDATEMLEEAAARLRRTPAEPEVVGYVEMRWRKGVHAFVQFSHDEFPPFKGGEVYRVVGPALPEESETDAPRVPTTTESE